MRSERIPPRVMVPRPTAALTTFTAAKMSSALRIGGWRNRSSGPAVPLSRIQTDILRLLAVHRDPESYVAGGRAPEPGRATHLRRHRRVSRREKRVAAAGYGVAWLWQHRRGDPWRPFIADFSIIFAKRNHNCRNYWFGVRVPCRCRLSGR